MPFGTVSKPARTTVASIQLENVVFIAEMSRMSRKARNEQDRGKKDLGLKHNNRSKV